MKAVWNGQVLADSNDTIVVEGNHYFPPSAINKDFFKDSDHQSVCPWKGTASYYSLEVDGESNNNAAWYYPSPSNAAKESEGYIAFWKGVQVTE